MMRTLSKLRRAATSAPTEGEGSLRAELLRLAKIHNYVPPSAERAYKEALLSEFKRRRGSSDG